MALSIKDMVKGTIVDHTYAFDENSQSMELRPVRRRGIIVRVDGMAQDAVTALYVLFKRGQEPEKVAPRELVRVYPWNSKVARKAYARITGTGEGIGAEFEERRAPIRPRVEDSLALTRRAPQAVVEPENDEVDPMIESQAAEPLVTPADDERDE